MKVLNAGVGLMAVLALAGSVWGQALDAPKTDAPKAQVRGPQLPVRTFYLKPQALGPKP